MLFWWWWDACVDLYDEALAAACDAYWQAEYERVVRQLGE
jgi:hypothetical protein